MRQFGKIKKKFTSNHNAKEATWKYFLHLNLQGEVDSFFLKKDFLKVYIWLVQIYALILSLLLLFFGKNIGFYWWRMIIWHFFFLFLAEFFFCNLGNLSCKKKILVKYNINFVRWSYASPITHYVVIGNEDRVVLLCNAHYLLFVATKI